MSLFTTYPILEQFASLLMGLAISSFLVLLGASWWGKHMNRQMKLIQNYEFPPSLKRFVQQQYPHLKDTELEQALAQLRLYFLICWEADRDLILPSKVVNVCWQGFMQERKSYAAFRRATFGRIFHQIPERSMNPARDISLKEGAQTYRAALALVKVTTPKKGTTMKAEPISTLRIPTHFSIDEALNIPQGYRFTDEAIQLMGNFEWRKKNMVRPTDP